MANPVNYLYRIECRIVEIHAQEAKAKQDAENRLKEVNNKMLEILDPILQLFKQASVVYDVSTNTVGPAIFCRNTGEYYFYNHPYIQSTLDMAKCKDKIWVHCDVSYHGEVECVKLYRNDINEIPYISSSANVGIDGIVSALIDIIINMSRTHSN